MPTALDALLYQVRGSRGDHQIQPELGQQVKKVQEPAILGSWREGNTTSVNRSGIDSRKSSGMFVDDWATTKGSRSDIRTKAYQGLHLFDEIKLSSSAESLASIYTRQSRARPHLVLVAPLFEAELSSADARTVAFKLSESVRYSGLFFENHLGQWLKGTLSLEKLSREPQIVLSELWGKSGAIAEESVRAKYTHLSNLILNKRAKAQSNQVLTSPNIPKGPALLEHFYAVTNKNRNSQSMSEQSLFSKLHVGSGKGFDLDKSKTTTWHVVDAFQSTIRQQVELVDSSSLLWEGELVPGIHLQMHINVRDDDLEEDNNQTNLPEVRKSKNWTVNFSLHLPALGEIRARLTSFQVDLDIELTTEKRVRGVDDLLRERRSDLVERFHLLGMNNVNFKISAESTKPLGANAPLGDLAIDGE